MGHGAAILAALWIAVVAAPAAAQVPGFTDVTVAAGLSYLQHDPPYAPPACIHDGGTFCQPGLMSGGAAVADVDGDGDQDLYVTRVDAPDILFANQGNGTFADVTAAAGLAGFDLQSNGAAFADIDNDGDADLLVTVLADAGDAVNDRNYLFVNDGTGVFSEEAVLRGADIPTAPSQSRYGWGIAVGDYDRDGWLDLLTSEWQNGGNATLLRNLGPASPGHFEDATAAAELDFININGFSPAFVDLDQDGWQDIALAADFETSQIWWNDGDGTFTNGTVAAGVGTDENGMGSAIADVDGDGDFDWFVTAIYDPADPCGQTGCNWGSSGNRLYRNDGGRVFTDITDAAGVRNGDFGWGAAFLDFDNDGDQDLTMTNGVDFPGVTLDDAFHFDPMRVWENDGTATAMAEVAASLGVVDTASGKGLLVFDYDQDGDQDLFVVNNAGMPALYRNDLTPGHGWLRVAVKGRSTNREGIGAIVTVWNTQSGPPQVTEIGVNSHLLGHSERIAHFGLGPVALEAERVEVYFPLSGKTVVRHDVSAGQVLTVNEPATDRCGLIGIEPLSLIVAMRRWRRRRLTSRHEIP